MTHQTALTCLLAMCIPLAIAPSNAIAQGVSQDNILIILDGSGSMNKRMPNNQSRLQAAKTALHAVMQSVPETTNVGLLVFSAHKPSHGWRYPLHRSTATNFPTPSKRSRHSAQRRSVRL